MKQKISGRKEEIGGSGYASPSSSQKFGNVPGKTGDGYIYYMTLDEFIHYVESHTFADESVEIFDSILDSSESYVRNDLTPMIVLDTLRGKIYATSEERLKGQFYQ